MTAVALAAENFVKARAACHEAGGLLDWPFAALRLVVERLHSELAHVGLRERDRGLVQQLLHLLQPPRPRTPRVLVEEMLAFPELPLLKRATKVNMLNRLCFL